MKCIHPTLINCNGSQRLVPCGRCAWCRKRKRDEWFVRFQMESLRFPCYFLTLTYDDEWIPCRYVREDDGETFVVRGFHDDILDDDVLQIGSVPYLKDWQDYMKRVRYRTSFDLKFFFVSEYGHLHGRVHYHALIWCSDPGIKQILVDEWHFGTSSSEPAGEGSMKYVTKYILKGSGKKQDGLRDDNIKTNSVGIGEGLIASLRSIYTSDDYKSTFRFLGSWHAFPHYIRKKIREILDNESDFVRIKIVRDNHDKLVVRNLHCDFVRMLDEKRSIPEINDKDVVHGVLHSGANDKPAYLQELYMNDYRKQFEINSKSNLKFQQ